MGINPENAPFLAKIPKMSHFGRKCPFLSENPESSHFWRKCPFWGKNFENAPFWAKITLFGQKFRKYPIWGENVHCAQPYAQHCSICNMHSDQTVALPRLRQGDSYRFSYEALIISINQFGKSLQCYRSMHFLALRSQATYSLSVNCLISWEKLTLMHEDK